MAQFWKPVARADTWYKGEYLVQRCGYLTQEQMTGTMVGHLAQRCIHGARGGTWHKGRFLAQGQAPGTSVGT